MKFSYHWLKKYVDIKLTPQKLAELLTLYSFESGVLDIDILNVDVLPNRAHDCLSHYGLAKEIAVVTKRKIKNLNINFKKSKDVKSEDLVSVEIKDKNLCSRYTALAITNVKIDPSPKWPENELRKFNIKPHNNVVDILNYVMLETGQPLHAFDYDKLSGQKIMVRNAKKGEKIKTLDGGKYDLNESVLVIADKEKPVAIAGIKGGLETGVSKRTKRIVIESANFESSSIRRTSRTLGLSTDAAVRFSYGLDPNLTEWGLNRAGALIQEIIPDVKIASSSVDVYPKKLFPGIIRLNLEYLNNLIGENIKLEFIRKTLESLGMKIKVAKKNSLLVAVPTIRLDLEREEDLIEEVGRLYGYMNLKSALPAAVLSVPRRNDENELANKSRDILTGLGFSETYNYSFVGKKEVSQNGKKNIIELQNPISAEYKYLRPDLMFSLFKNIANNFRFFGKIKLFEFGKVFAKIGAKPRESMMLGAVAAIKEAKEPAAGRRFFEMKGDLDTLLEKLGISDCYYDPTLDEKLSNNLALFSEEKWWHGGRLAYIRNGEDLFGIIGEINPAVLETLGIKGRAAAFSLDFEKLLKITRGEKEFLPIPKFPSVIRDIAILVDREVRVSEVLNVIYGAGAELVEDVDLFDYYEGEELPEGRKNLAFHIVYQADHTLTDEEVRREEEKIKSALVKKLSAEIR